jgi:hypothetical protein
MDSKELKELGIRVCTVVGADIILQSMIRSSKDSYGHAIARK